MKRYTVLYFFAMLTTHMQFVAQLPPITELPHEDSDAEEETPRGTDKEVQEIAAYSPGSNASSTGSSRSNSPTPPAAPSKPSVNPVFNSPQSYNNAHGSEPKQKQEDLTGISPHEIHKKAIEQIFIECLDVINKNPDQKNKKQLLDNFFNKTVPFLYRDYIAQHFNRTSKMNRLRNEDAYDLAVKTENGFRQRYGFNVFKQINEKYRAEYGFYPIKDKDYAAFLNNEKK